MWTIAEIDIFFIIVGILTLVACALSANWFYKSKQYALAMFMSMWVGFDISTLTTLVNVYFHTPQ